MATSACKPAQPHDRTGARGRADRPPSHARPKQAPSTEGQSRMSRRESAAGRIQDRDDGSRGAGVDMSIAEASGAEGAERARPGTAIDMGIVVCTLDRPQGLVRAVRSCLEQQNRSDVSYEILIVDNSATASARELVERLWGEIRIACGI